jgi:hypothetical protein
MGQCVRRPGLYWLPTPTLAGNVLLVQPLLDSFELTLLPLDLVHDRLSPLANEQRTCVREATDKPTWDVRLLTALPRRSRALPA